MAELFKGKYRISSARLQGWDYADPGYYFVTICVKNFAMAFGCISDGTMDVNRAGKIVEQLWREIADWYPQVRLDQYIVMPNHIHGIIQILSGNPQCTDAIHGVSETGNALNGACTNNADTSKMAGAVSVDRNPMTRLSLSTIIRRFKGRVTHDIRRHLNSDFAWQPRFHDHIIRNEQDLRRIREYIENNPRNWDKDELYQSS